MRQTLLAVVPLAISAIASPVVLTRWAVHSDLGVASNRPARIARITWASDLVACTGSFIAALLYVVFVDDEKHVTLCTTAVTALAIGLLLRVQRLERANSYPSARLWSAAQESTSRLTRAIGAAATPGFLVEAATVICLIWVTASTD